jgi:hypothetical protein
MPDEPNDQTPTEPQASDADRLLAELSELKTTLAAEREASQGLRESFVQAFQATQRAPAPATPPPEPEDVPTPEEFEEDHANATARLAATMIKRGLSEYHQTTSGETAALRDAVLTMEWDRVRQEDPKNFDRLSKHVNQALQQPGARRPGAIRDIFYRLRGQYMPQLQEMDRKERLAEPVPEPNAPTGTPPEPAKKFDTLNAEEILVIKGMRSKPSEYFYNKHGKAPEFEEGYLRSLGLPEETKQ